MFDEVEAVLFGNADGGDVVEAGVGVEGLEAQGIEGMADTGAG